MSDFVFQGMEYVYEVYRAGSFRQAAENLLVSQPSISASVRRAEERIGTPIFDRSFKPLRLTQCGERYIDAVEKIMTLEQEFTEYVNDWGGLLRGTLTVGGSSLFSSMILPPILSRFRDSFPDISLELVENTTGELEAMLQSGTIDMVVDYEIPHSESYDYAILEDEILLLAVPKDMDVNANLKSYRVDHKKIQNAEALTDSVPPVPLERFREQPFILLKSGNDSRRRADDLCSRYGFMPKPLLEFDQQMTSYRVSCSGLGVCFVSSTLVRLLGPSKDMIYYRLSGSSARRQICLFWKKDRYFTRAMDEFKRFALYED